MVTPYVISLSSGLRNLSKNLDFYTCLFMRPNRRPAAASRRSLQACSLPCHCGPPGCQRHTSGRTTSMGADHTIKLMKTDPVAMEAQREEIKARYGRIFRV